MEKNKIQGGMPLGTSLLIVVFIILCLVTFATLSFVSSNADNELSISTGTYIEEYYAADSLAQAEIKKINDLILPLSTGTVTPAAFFASSTALLGDTYDVFPANSIGLGEGIIVEFQTNINETQNLMSSIHIMVSETNTPIYEIISWKTENISANSFN